MWSGVLCEGNTVEIVTMGYRTLYQRTKLRYIFISWISLCVSCIFQRRSLPAVPTSNDLAFVPLQTDRSMEAQLAVVDIVLHKATDEIVNVDTSLQTSDPADRIQYSDSIQRLQRCKLLWYSVGLNIACSLRLRRKLHKFFCQCQKRIFKNVDG